MCKVEVFDVIESLLFFRICNLFLYMHSPKYICCAAPGLISLSGTAPGFPGPAPGYLSLSVLSSLGPALFSFLEQLLDFVQEREERLVALTEADPTVPDAMPERRLVRLHTAGRRAPGDAVLPPVCVLAAQGRLFYTCSSA